jgi:hypothetical protein
MTDEDVRFQIKEVFSYRRRTLVIVEILNVPTVCAPSGSCHNGYVSVARRNKGVGYELVSRIKSVELTYTGMLNHFKDKRIPNAWFLGFDTLHYWNGEHPASQTFGAVHKKTIELADEMIRKRI